MLSKFFIERPIFAGGSCHYGDGTWDFFSIKFTCRTLFRHCTTAYHRQRHVYWAGVETVEESVTQVLEQQIKGLDHLMYFSS